MISSDMPVFIARVALCRTWLAGAKRSSKKSFKVGFAGIGVELLDVTAPRWPVNTPAGAAPEVARLDLRLDLGDGRELLGLLPGGDHLVQLLFHVVLERFGLGLVIHEADSRGAAKTRDEGSPIDFHATLLCGQRRGYAHPRGGFNEKTTIVSPCATNAGVSPSKPIP